MTTVPLSLVINRAQAIVRLSGIPASFTGSLASNISFVQFDGEKGIGTIIYNDRPQLPETFTDPSPYQSAVNDWITARATLSVNALTLAQARAVKCALVSAIGKFKANVPVPVTVSAGSYSWSADGNEALLGGLSWVVPLNNVINGVEGMFTHVNSAFSTLTTGIDSSLSASQTSVNAAFSNLKGSAGLGTGLDGQFSAASLSIVTPLERVSFPSVSAPTISDPGLTPLSVPSLTAVPYGGTSSVTLTGADVQAIVSAITSQASTVQAAVASKQGAVNALSTIAAVISYDATTGW